MAGLAYALQGTSKDRSGNGIKRGIQRSERLVVQTIDVEVRFRPR